MAAIHRFVGRLAAALLAAGLAAAGPVGAQEYDLTARYSARTTFPTTDNDILALSAGLTWLDGQGGGRRLVLSAGVRNENFSGIYPALAGVEYMRVHGRGEGNRLGYGARLDWAEDRTVAGELAAGWERFYGRHDIRATLGLQGQGEELLGRDDLGVFGVVEYSFYPTDHLALRTGAQVDTDGEIVTAAVEMQIFETPFSFALEYTRAPESYRGRTDYDDLTGAIVWSPGRRALVDRDRALPMRLLSRYSAVQ